MGLIALLADMKFGPSYEGKVLVPAEGSLPYSNNLKYCAAGPSGSSQRALSAPESSHCDVAQLWHAGGGRPGGLRLEH